MGLRIILQENGNYGLFSTISDRISALDCTEAELIQIWRDRAAERAEEEMKGWLEDIKEGRMHGTMTAKEALKTHKFHSEKFVKKHPPEYDGEIEWDKELRKFMQENLK